MGCDTPLWVVKKQGKPNIIMKVFPKFIRHPKSIIKVNTLAFSHGQSPQYYTHRALNS
jgi:hypothetical protein